MGKVISAVLAAAVLAGCAAQTAGLSLTEVRALKIETIEVGAKPDANIWWGKAEREYAEKAQAGAVATPAVTKVKSKAADPVDSTAAHAALVESPEGRAYVRQRAIDMLKARLDQQVAPAYQGTRRVKLIVSLTGMHIPSAAQRIVFGGTPLIAGSIVVVDLATGAEIAKSPQPIIAAAQAGNGVIGVLVDQAFADLEDRLTESFAARIKQWLPATAPDTTGPKTL